MTNIGSPLFKVDWKGAPQFKYSPKRDQFNASRTVSDAFEKVRNTQSRRLKMETC